MASQFLWTSKSVERLQSYLYSVRSSFCPRLENNTHYAGKSRSFRHVDAIRISHSEESR